MKEGDKYYTFNRVQGRNGEELIALVWTVFRDEGRRAAHPEDGRWAARSCDFTGHSTTENLIGDVGQIPVITPQQAVEWAVGVHGEQFRRSVTEQLRLMGEM